MRLVNLQDIHSLSTRSLPKGAAVGAVVILIALVAIVALRIFKKRATCEITTGKIFEPVAGKTPTDRLIKEELPKITTDQVIAKEQLPKITTMDQVIVLVKKSIDSMDPLAIWVNYKFRANFKTPNDPKMADQFKIHSSGDERLFALKTEDGRFWQINSSDSNICSLTQHTEDGGSSFEVCDTFPGRPYDIPVSVEDWNEIKQKIENKLTR